MDKIFRSGFVSIIGRSNVGKSTLLNALVGSEVAIVSPKPQTTRHHIKGILNAPGSQVIFTDTPGIFSPRKKMDRMMVKAAYNNIQDMDVLLLVVEPKDDKQGDSGFINDFDKNLIKKFDSCSGKKFLLINKIDKYPEENILNCIEKYNAQYRFDHTVPLSARTGKGLKNLLTLIQDLLPEGPQYFPEDMRTDRREEFMLSELIRQQVIMLTDQEIPYAAGAFIESVEETDKLIRISGKILVENLQHKKILVGAKGSMIKKIGTLARKRMEHLLKAKVFLELVVIVKPGWQEDGEFLLRQSLVD